MTEPTFVFRKIIFIEWNRQIAANAMAQAWDFDTGGFQTFGAVRLSPTGEEPPTHTAANTGANQSMNDGIQIALGSVPWANLYDGMVWTWTLALADMGLQVIPPEDI